MDTGYGHYTYVARIQMGMEMMLHGDKEEGSQWLHSIPKSEKTYHALANRLLAKLSGQTVKQETSQ